MPQEKLQVTDDEWEKLKRLHYDTKGFIEALEKFDSIRHHTGAGDFSAQVYADIQKLKELSVKVFDEGRRDCITELFSICSSMGTLMENVEVWLSEVRTALASLGGVKPRSLVKK